jgi:hypothetical protein
MPSKTVEFRYLQVVTNHLSGDRVTVGLAHWDGRELRFASSLAGIRRYDLFSDIARSVKGIRYKISRAAHQSRRGYVAALFEETLSDILPGHVLAGDSLIWSDTRRGTTNDPGSHFAELAGKLSLIPATDDVPRLSMASIHDALEELARDFDTYPDLVRASVPLHDHYAYTSPVSWMNGRWNHAVPLNLDVANRAELESRIRNILARVITAIPENDAPVLVAALPTVRSPSAPNVEKEAEYARAKIGPLARLAYVRGAGRVIDVAPVREMITADIAPRVAGRRP